MEEKKATSEEEDSFEIPYLNSAEFNRLYCFDESDLLNEGSFGQVYQLKQQRLVIKKFKNDTMFDQFMIELNFNASVIHPCILRPIAWSTNNKDGIGYLIFPLGEDIKMAYEKKKTRLIDIFMDVLSALAFLNSRGIAHLDVKPQNIVFHHGRAKLIDMGSAKYALLHSNGKYYVSDAAYSAHCRDPEYSPYQHNDINSEVYALGATCVDIWLQKNTVFASAPHYVKKMKPENSEMKILLELTLSEVQKRPNAVELFENVTSIQQQRQLNSARFKNPGKHWEDTCNNTTNSWCEQFSLPSPNERKLLAKYSIAMIHVLYAINVPVDVLFLALHLLHRTRVFLSLLKSLEDRSLYFVVLMNMAIKTAYSVNPSIHFSFWGNHTYKYKTNENGDENANERVKLRQIENYETRFRMLSVDILRYLRGVVITKTYWHYAKSKKCLKPLLEDLIFSNYGRYLCDCYVQPEISLSPLPKYLPTQAVLKTNTNGQLVMEEYLFLETIRSVRWHITTDTCGCQKAKIHPSEFPIQSEAEVVVSILENDNWEKQDLASLENDICILIHNKNALCHLDKKIALHLFQQLLYNRGLIDDYLACFTLNKICPFEWQKYGSYVLENELHPFYSYAGFE